jgi:CubicO group peptidase (beta-lactamase class C family)
LKVSPARRVTRTGRTRIICRRCSARSARRGTTTLAELGIDDTPSLTRTEQAATLRMGLQARSGVYHPSVGGLLADREAMPARGSHPPGSFWYYNNWDFNVLGTVCERHRHVKIAAEFRDRIAVPIQMQAFRLEDRRRRVVPHVRGCRTGR